MTVMLYPLSIFKIIGSFDKFFQFFRKCFSLSALGKDGTF